jgi:hypothetical protein
MPRSAYWSNRYVHRYRADSAPSALSNRQLGMSDKSHSDKSSSGDDIDVDDDADRQLVGGENVSPTCTVITEFMPHPHSWVGPDVLGTGESSSWTQSGGT